MIEEKKYDSPTIEIKLLSDLDIIRTSNPVFGEDGNDIFDDR